MGHSYLAALTLLLLTIHHCESKLIKRVVRPHEARDLLGSVSNLLQAPIDLVSDVAEAPFEVAGKVVEVVKPVAGEDLAGLAHKTLDLSSDVVQLPIGLVSDVAKLPFELISDLGKTGGDDGLACCTEVPLLNEMMEEAERLHGVVANCSTRIGVAVIAITSSRQKRGLFSSDSSLYNILTKPISIASNVAQLPFKVVGEGVKIPLKIASTVIDIASPLLGERLSSILTVPLNTLNKFAQLPFEIGAEFIQMPFGVAENLAKLPFDSPEEAAAARYCCGRMNMVDQMLEKTTLLRSAAELCASQLDEIARTLKVELYRK